MTVDETLNLWYFKHYLSYDICYNDTISGAEEMTDFSSQDPLK